MCHSRDNEEVKPLISMSKSHIDACVENMPSRREKGSSKVAPRMKVQEPGGAQCGERIGGAVSRIERL